MEKKSINRSIAGFVYDISYEKLPDSVTHRAKLVLLDTLGAIIHGRDMERPRIALELVKNNKGVATTIGHDLKVPPPDAAFVNSVMAASNWFDDFQFTYHPGQVALPTAMAVGEQEGCSGAELITALVAGYEVMGRIYLGAPNISPRFRGVGAYGPFGAAATAGKLLKLNEDQLTSALGHAANLAAGLGQFMIDGTMEGNFCGGLIARNGMMAANLARVGVIASERSLEGDCGFYMAYAGTTAEATNALLDLNKRFLIMEASYKPYPVCALQQVPIELISNLMRRERIKPNDIKEVVERVSEWAAAFPGGNFSGPFENADQTLQSFQFCAASAFLAKPVWSYSYYREAYNDPEVLTLAQKVKLIGEKDRQGTEITVTLHSGETYRVEEKGKETLTPSDKKISTKFLRLTSDYLEEKKAKEFIDRVMSLEHIKDVRELTDLLSLNVGSNVDK